jgi:gliding motility-associated-like protein
MVKSNHGCFSEIAATHSFIIERAPAIEGFAENGCVDLPVIFSATQIDNATMIERWSWEFGDGNNSNEQLPTHIYNEAGNYEVKLRAIGTNGCSSAAIVLPVFINKAFPNAGRDTMILKDVPLQLQGSGGGIYEWSPVTGLNNRDIPNPVATLEDDITYTLKVTTNEGCVGTDQIKIEVFKGSFIYVPTGFTPDGNGLNDQLLPSYGGIKELNYFSIFNRWGELIYTTKNQAAGWDGTIKGVEQPTGVYVWMIRAIDFVGKEYELKGTTTIIR